MTFTKESKVSDGCLWGSYVIGDFKKSADLLKEYVSS